MLNHLRARLILTAFAAAVSLGPALHAQADHSKPAGILQRDEAGALIPATVFFRGQTASVQARNSAGVRDAAGRLVLFTLVDTSGYSSGVAQRYQGYLLTEVPLHLGSKTLAPGAYGFGFVADGMLVMDIGDHDLLHLATSTDAQLARPMPLQIKPEGKGFRLYLGRTFVHFEAGAAQ